MLNQVTLPSGYPETFRVRRVGRAGDGAPRRVVIGWRRTRHFLGVIRTEVSSFVPEKTDRVNPYFASRSPPHFERWNNCLDSRCPTTLHVAFDFHPLQR
jgi:hypothetical protein